MPGHPHIVCSLRNSHTSTPHSLPPPSCQPPYNALVKQAIILFSHGSVLCGAGETLAHLADRMRARGDVSIVEVGYLNYSEPSFAVAFDRCIEAGATEVHVLPYFLVPGKFVRVDLPRAVAAVRARYPDIDVRMGEAIGPHPALADALLACAERATPLAEWRRTLPDPAGSCRANPRCPLFGTSDCPATKVAA